MLKNVIKLAGSGSVECDTRNVVIYIMNSVLIFLEQSLDNGIFETDIISMQYAIVSRCNRSVLREASFFKVDIVRKFVLFLFFLHFSFFDVEINCC